jgi:hypothetical protein
MKSLLRYGNSKSNGTNLGFLPTTLHTYSTPQFRDKCGPLVGQRRDLAKRKHFLLSQPLFGPPRRPSERDFRAEFGNKTVAQGSQNSDQASDF